MSDLNPRPYAGVVFPDEWDAENGLPDVASVANAIQVWTMLQGSGRVTVRRAGDVFNLDDAQVRQAVAAHYWMFLDGPDDDPHRQFIEHDGE
jgi:hypothetical protein